LIRPPFNDPRDFFSEARNYIRFAAAGIPGPFAQDHHAVSTGRGVLRELQRQTGPNAQGKSVHCTKGAIFDVAIDARPGLPTLGQWVSAEYWTQIWVGGHPARLLCADGGNRGDLQG
jgi:dTDP-4-dehydrorhamnose 3,5-epimerase